jgi:hypothetical protein
MQEDADEDGPFIPPSYLTVQNGSLPDFFLASTLVLVPDGFSDFSAPHPIGPQSLDPSQRSEDVFSSPDQLAEELATLTLLPRSRWQTLLKLEVIQVSRGMPLWC